MLRSPLLLTVLGPLVSVGAVGCLQPADERPDAEATSTTATAVVVVERTTGPGDAVRGDAVIARFVRVPHGAVDEQALRMAGVVWDLPALGTCSSAPESQPALLPRNIELLDVGVLTVDGASGSSRAVAVPRTMPDPTGLVTGVFYSARSAEAFTASTRLQLRTSGGPDMAEGFAVNVPAPRDVADVRVISSAAGLDVAWEEEAASNDARDLVHVDVLGPSSRLIARCTTLDVGHALIPASALASLGTTEEGQLAVHRLRRESFKAKGIEPGEVRFDIARVVTFRR